MLTIGTFAVALIHSTCIAYDQGAPLPVSTEVTAPANRPVTLTLSAGSRMGNDSREPDTTATGLTLGFRLNARVVGPWSASVDYTGDRDLASASHLSTPLGTLTLGVQWFPVSILYLRGAAGASIVGHNRPDEGVYRTAVGAVGLDLPASSHLSLNIEVAGTAIRLPESHWNALSFRLGLTWY